ncbi:MAG: pyruvate formate-lyase 1-activating enzyme [Actinobacteria bacterium HGW-Actinobacteria-4]|nr:MAG: pyruvate formate-lyase 1-activating enzyme [Actinobacteria bacterium HGW-Actinobacteria-4]
MAISVPLPLSPPPMAEANEELRDSVRERGETGSVHSWELVTAVDGPGSRLTVFLAGCALRCQYCQNPDTWRMSNGVRHTVAEVMEKVARYEKVLKATGGGLTVSGGEPLLQADFVERIFHEAKKLNIHTALDTSGFLGARASNDLLHDTDLVLLDVKSGDPEIYRQVTGRALEPTLDFGRRLSAQGITIWLRYVLVPGLTDTVENVAAVAEYAGSLDTVERVEVLPFHQMGRDKWTALKQEYTLADTEPPSAELIQRVRDQFAEHGLTVF